MEARRVVVEQVWELLAISSIDSKSVRYKIPGAFFISVAQECDCLNRQNLEPLEEVMLMGNWR
jgi:hypothetical protein